MKLLRIARLIARLLLLLTGGGAAVVGVAQLTPRGCMVRAQELLAGDKRAAMPAGKPAAHIQLQKSAALRGGLHLVARSQNASSQEQKRISSL